MALRLLGRKLIVKPQKLGFYFRNNSHTAVVHDNPPSDPHARIFPCVLEEYHVNVLEENRRLKEENRQLIENRRLKEKNRQLIENHRLKEENRQLIERLKPVEEETIGDLQCDTHKDDASTTINELFENVTRLEQKILGDLRHDIQNERDRCRSLETKQEHDWLKKEEVPRLKKENCQLTERLKSMEEILICYLQEENRQLKERLKQMGEDIIGDLQRDTQKLEEASQKIEEMNKVGENLRDILSEERKRQDIKKENLITKLKDDASNTINGLFGKVTRLEQTVFGDLHNEKDRCNSLETKLDKALRENEQMEEELDRLRRYD